MFWLLSKITQQCVVVVTDGVAQKKKSNEIFNLLNL